MLLESSMSTATTFCCGTAARTISVGRNRQNSTSASAATRSAGQHDAVARASLVDAHAAIGQNRERDDGGDEQRGDERARRDVEAQLTLLKDDRPIREQRLKHGIRHGSSERRVPG